MGPGTPAGATAKSVARQSVTNVVVHTSPEAAGYPGTSDNTGAKYSITFTATDGLGTSGDYDVLIQAPVGTELGGGITVTNNTNPADTNSFICGGQGGASYIYELGGPGCHVKAGDGDSVTITFSSVINPSTPGNYTLTVATNNDPTPATSAPYRIAPEGYWLVGSDGGIFTFGNASFYGSTGNLHLNRPVVGITVNANRTGYWLDASDGGVFSFGSTQFYGSIPGIGLSPAGSGLPHSLNAPIVGMVPSVDDGGYFMVASDGGVFAFGDAKFEGSCPGIGGCVGTAVAVMPDASGAGYWLVTSAGAVYAFGDAPHLGAPGNTGSPITSAVRTPSGNGYWILDASGTVHAYGDAASLGNDDDSYGDNSASAIFTDIAGDGYGIATEEGELTTFGGVPNYGGMYGTTLNGSIIAASGY